MDLKALLGESYKDGMTLEEITAALADKTFVDPSTLPKSVTKDVFDKTASELAAANKKLKEKLTDDEQSAAQQKEFQDQLAAIQKENQQMKLEKQFLSGGYDSKTAVALAEAAAGGDMAKFTELNTKFMEGTKTALQASIKADLLKETPGLQGGGKPGDGTEPSIGEKAAQAYNQQFAPASAAAQTQTN